MNEQTGDFSGILNILKDNPRGMSVTELADAAHVNRNTIARYMDNLLISGRVEMRTFGKAKVFFISKRIPVSAMLNLSSEMVLLIDSDLIVIQANEALLTFLSCTADEITGSCIYTGKCGILCSGVLTDQIKSALRGEIVRGELRLFKAGEECILDQRIYPIALPDGRPGVTIMLDNITERVNAESALEQSEAMFRRLVETVHDVIWSVDENSVIQYISPQVTEVAGYDVKEMIGKRFSDFMPNGANERFSWELCSELSRENGFALQEFPLITKDSRKIYCEFSGTPILLEEDRTIFLGYNGALRNVTDQRKAERGAKRWKFFLDSVLDNIPGIITVTDPKTHQYYYVNKAADEFLGIKRASLLKMTSTEVLNSIGAVQLQNAETTAASFKERVHVTEELVQTRFGPRPISARVLPMTLSVGREYLITIVHDITDEVADRRRQELTRELAFTLEGVMTTQDMWTPVMEMLPKISGFESVAVYQRSLFSDYVLYRSAGGKFASAVPVDSILDRVIRKGDPVIFDKYRMELLPTGSLSLMEGAKALVLLPVIVESVPVACIVLGSAAPLLPDAILCSLLISLSFQISNVASRCFVQEKLTRERDRTRKYIDIANVLLVAVNRDGQIEMINRHGAKLLGYSETDLIGKNWFEMFVPSSVREKRVAAFEKMLLGNDPGDDHVYNGLVLCADGTEKMLQWRNALLREECGSVSGVVSSGEIVE